jgi:hypothetical protein
MSRKLCFLLAGGLLGLLIALSLPLLAFLNRECWNLPKELRDYQTQRDRRLQLDHKNEVLLWRLNNQGPLVRELLAGRISFLQVAACFKYLNENPPEEKTPFLPFLGSTPEEKTCRQVICWVESYMRRYPETRDEALLRRLHQELAEMLNREEGVQLPLLTQEFLDEQSRAGRPGLTN